MIYAVQNKVLEWHVKATVKYKDSYNNVTLYAEITDSNNVTKNVPAFYMGENTWGFRYASKTLGKHVSITKCSNVDDIGLHNVKHSIMIEKYEGENELYKHGRINVSNNKLFFQHEDEKPFFWLGDTWWMGLSKRLQWPSEFKTLTEDRVAKGFSVIQIVAGLYPDMTPFDERGKNEVGFPWDEEFEHINPDYFEMADRRIEWIVENGMVPCIVGSWGYFMDFAGYDAMKKHWRNLIGRYGAYPVVWCVAGEATMPFYGCVKWPEKKNEKYLQYKNNPDKRKEYEEDVKVKWTNIAKYIKELDPYNNIVTIHPTDYGHKMVTDPSVLDMNMLQTGHSGWGSIGPTIDMVEKTISSDLNMPTINSEVCYEGIGGMCGPEVQRYLFWSCMLSGCAGFTYGANGIWQINRLDKPYGASPWGMIWGNTDWVKAMNRDGSYHLGYSKKLLEKYKWWEFKPHSEWCSRHANKNNRLLPYCGGIENEVRMIYLPASLVSVVSGLESGVEYYAFFYDPSSGQKFVIGDIIADQNGEWSMKNRVLPIYTDLILVIENKKD